MSGCQLVPALPGHSGNVSTWFPSTSYSRLVVRSAATPVSAQEPCLGMSMSAAATLAYCQIAFHQLNVICELCRLRSRHACKTRGRCIAFAGSSSTKARQAKLLLILPNAFSLQALHPCKTFVAHVGPVLAQGFCQRACQQQTGHDQVCKPQPYGQGQADTIKTAPRYIACRGNW